MKTATLHIAQLFGDNVLATPTVIHEDFQRLECEYRFKLTKTPVKESLLAVLPAISERDSWRLHIFSGGDEVDDVERDEELTKCIMRSYARNQASQATAGTILADIKHKSISGTVHMG